MSLRVVPPAVLLFGGEVDVHVDAPLLAVLRRRDAQLRPRDDAFRLRAEDAVVHDAGQDASVGDAPREALRLLRAGRQHLERHRVGVRQRPRLRRHGGARREIEPGLRPAEAERRVALRHDLRLVRDRPVLGRGRALLGGCDLVVDLRLDVHRCKPKECCLRKRGNGK